MNTPDSYKNILPLLEEQSNKDLERLEQYAYLMNMFLNRKQKRALERRKEVKSFKDRVYQSILK